MTKSFLNRSPRLLIGLIVLAVPVILSFIFLRWWPEKKAQTAARQHERVAEAQWRAGNASGAESEWLLAITAWPEDVAAYSRLGDLYRDEKEPEVAGVAYRRLLEIQPHYPHVYCRLALAADDYGSEEDARGYATQELKKDPNCDRALVLLSRKDRGAGHRDLSRAEAEHAYHVAPKNEEAVLAYAESWLPEQPDRAAPILEQASVDLPHSWKVHYDLGYCYVHGAGGPQGSARAEAELNRALAINPGWGLAYRELCRLMQQEHNQEKAVSAGALAVRYSPYDLQSWYDYALSLQRAGRRPEAAAAFGRFNTLQAAGQERTTLQERYGKLPDDPAKARDLAACDRKLGDDRAALRVLEAALTAHPDDLPLRQEVARLTESGSSSPETLLP